MPLALAYKTVPFESGKFWHIGDGTECSLVRNRYCAGGVPKTRWLDRGGSLGILLGIAPVGAGDEKAVLGGDETVSHRARFLMGIASRC